MIDKNIFKDEGLLAAYQSMLTRRGANINMLEIVEYNNIRRESATKLQDLQARRKKNDLSASKDMVKEAQSSFDHIDGLLTNSLLELPNILAQDVPNGLSEQDNVVVDTYGEQHATGIEHHESEGIKSDLGAKLSGSRFTVLSGYVAKLHRAVGQFLLDHAGLHSFEEHYVPFIVNTDTMTGTGQLPKFKNDAYDVGSGQWLIPTSEVSLTNLFRNEKITSTQRVTALTPCFRKEAGSAGKDTKGLIRQHQFEKVELVTVCKPDQSELQHEYMCKVAEIALQKLGLSYRKILLCAGDTGFSAMKTYDLEVWMAGSQTYREISSISNCGDFQARRMNIKTDKKEFAHTLNGSSLAVGRCVAALLETYGEQIPEALVPYFSINPRSPRSFRCGDELDFN